ncbi:uncharacterized protein LOC134238229 [Saccostrea cucullata]|uniref:uncharacterized protein LOC134238229 n=1 Tax=Saccostrea cuccullata TaxID=36930 RepID=UPI002ED64101
MPPKKRQEPGPNGQTRKRQRRQRSSSDESLPQIDYNKLAEAILKKQGRVTETDNGESPVSLEPSKDVETPLQAPSVNCLPDTANTAVNTNNVLGAAQQSSFLLTLDKIFGGESIVSSSVDDNNVTPLQLSGGIPLGATIPLRVKQKIWANQYIDLRVLLPEHKQETVSVQIEEGSIKLNAKQSEKTPLSIYQWTNAFITFMSIYIESNSQSASNLLKYMSTVRHLHASNGESAWRLYDEQFRKLREVSDLPWQQPLNELIIRVTTMSKSHNQTFPRNISSNNRSFRGPIRFCYTYNNRQQCTSTNCPYRHICSVCKETHPRIRCTKQKSDTQNATNSQSQRQSGKSKPTNPSTSTSS